MIYLMISVTLIATVVSIYCCHQVLMLKQQMEHLEDKFIHTLESLDYVISKLDLVRESIKSIRQIDEEVDESDWWKHE